MCRAEARRWRDGPRAGPEENIAKAQAKWPVSLFILHKLIQFIILRCAIHFSQTL